MIKVTSLKCEYADNPLGIDTQNPRFSWQIESDGQNVMQESYKIEVSLNEDDFISPIWDSGIVASDQSVHVKYEGPELSSDTFYYWRVQIQANEGKSDWSMPAYWHTGLLNEHDWLAKWIEPSEKPTACPMLRKEFSLKGNVESAYAFVSGVGLYELRLNGQKVGEDYLTPGWTSYNKRIQYQTYDVTDAIKEKNALGIILADGWYKGHLTWHNINNMYGERYAALIQMHIKYDNGESEIIVTDDSWRWTESEISSAEIYHGETSDLRLYEKGWDSFGYDDAKWRQTEVSEYSPEKIISQINTPVRVMQEIKPIEIITTPKGETVIDMGQNMTGFVRLDVDGKTGDKIVLRHFEVLGDDGNVFLENLVHAKQKDEYILGEEGAVSLQPRFTFHGFRYVYLEEFPYEPKLEQFTGLVLYSDMETTGYFETSDALINKLQENILWSQKGNFVDIPSDCPQRSERLGWTGDVQIFVKTAAFNMACEPFFAKWLGDLTEDQKADGLVPWVIPDVVEEYMYPKQWLEGSGQTVPSSAGWGDAAVVVPWMLYICYGDKSILKMQYDSMTAWVEYIRAQGENEFLWNTGFHFGDWLARDTNKENVFGATSTDFVASAYYAYSTQLMYRTAQVLGKNDDYEKYKNLHSNILKEFRKEFVTNTGRLSDYTQAAHVLALAFGLIEDSHVQRIADTLEKLIAKNSYKINTGFLGTPHFCYALSQNGKMESAIKVLLQKECPSWLYEVEQGATTIWEYWDNDERKASYNHYAFGSIGEWMYSVLGGINIDEENPGYKHSIIAPYFAPQFEYVRAGIKTMYGLLECDWKREKDGITLSVKIPHNTCATVRLANILLTNIRINDKTIKDDICKEMESGVEITLGSGKYQIDILG